MAKGSLDEGMLRWLWRVYEGVPGGHLHVSGEVGKDNDPHQCGQAPSNPLGVSVEGGIFCSLFLSQDVHFLP